MTDVPTDPPTREAARRDLLALRGLLRGRFSLLHANDFGARLDDLVEAERAAVPDRPTLEGLAEQVRRLLSHSVDGHSAVREYRTRPGVLPLLTPAVGDGVLAVRPDRSGFLDGDRPWLVAIDGVPLDDWRSAAAGFVARGSPQFVRRHAARGVAFVGTWRPRLGLPDAASAVVTLAPDPGGADGREVRVELADKAPPAAPWPPPASDLDGDVPCLRLPSMSPDAAGAFAAWWPRRADARGLILDVRGNGGGARAHWWGIAEALVGPDAAPAVMNAARVRLGVPEGPQVLEGRALRAADDPRWTPAQRAAIDAFRATFAPAWTPPEGGFGETHFALRPARTDDTGFDGPPFEGPVAVLCDAGCFSATDVFLTALRGLPNVTLIGGPSGGGSGAPLVHVLPESGLHVRFASMVSYQPDGRLFDGVGVPVDVTVPEEPEGQLVGGRDAAREVAIARIRGLARAPMLRA